MPVFDIRQVKAVPNDSALALRVPRFEFGKGSRSLKSNTRHKEMFGLRVSLFLTLPNSTFNRLHGL